MLNYPHIALQWYRQSAKQVT